MRPTGVRVHIRFGDCAGRTAFLDHIVDVVFSENFSLSDIINIGATDGVLALADFQIVIYGVEEVFDFFHINFQERDLDLKANMLISLLQTAENMAHHPRNNSLHFDVFGIRSHHRVRLSR